MSQRRVEIVERKRVYDGFFKLDVARVRHELFRGGMSPELKREIFVQRQAVAVLPYDPRADRVVLVEQFRAGTIDWGGEPWLLEAVAGILDKDGEAVEAAAKREVKEECGLELGRLDFAGLYASSPGGTTERVHTFVGEVTAPESGGVHGARERARGHPPDGRPGRGGVRDVPRRAGSSPPIPSSRSSTSCSTATGCGASGAAATCPEAKRHPGLPSGAPAASSALANDRPGLRASMHARIYQPAKPATQSGRFKTRIWIVEPEPRSRIEADRLIGWIGSDSTDQQVLLRFPTQEAAVDFCDRHGITYTLTEPHQRVVKPKSYAENFIRKV